MKCVICKQELKHWYNKYYRCNKCYRIYAGSALIAEKVEDISSTKEAPPHE